jgi:hypothetical protein
MTHMVVINRGRWEDGAPPNTGWGDGGAGSRSAISGLSGRDPGRSYGQTTNRRRHRRGGGLPVTKAATGLSAAAGVLLVLAGAGGYLLARRRRVRLTA